jgi:hypothetical protein
MTYYLLKNKEVDAYERKNKKKNKRAKRKYLEEKGLFFKNPKS